MSLLAASARLVGTRVNRKEDPRFAYRQRELCR
jgi:hypothetical protein